MEIDPAYGSFHLIEADIVKALKTGSGNCPHPMIRDQKVLFPPHEDMLTLRKVSVREIRFLGLLRERPPGRKSGPMMHIGLFCSTPRLMARLEGMFGADDFPFEECRQGWVVLREAWQKNMGKRHRYANYLYTRPPTLYAEISTEIRLGHINMLDFHIHIVYLAVGLLGADKLASRSQE